MEGVGRVVQNNLYRNALNNLYKIAGGILGRKEREIRASSALKAVDVPPQPQVGKGVNRNYDGLTSLHVSELSLFEVRYYIDFVWHGGK